MERVGVGVCVVRGVVLPHLALPLLLGVLRLAARDPGEPGLEDGQLAHLATLDRLLLTWLGAGVGVGLGLGLGVGVGVGVGVRVS